MGKKFVVLTALLLGLLLVGSPVASAAAPAIPVSGSAINADGQTVNFAGTLNITKFAIQNNRLVAVGNLTGTLTNAITGAVQSVLQNVAIPVTAATATCEVLHLELGPLDLTLLGLNVHLNKIVLDITATPGGGLLGNLLCSLAGGLNLNNITLAIVNLLNSILGAL
jgi:hypothetical protein